MKQGGGKEGGRKRPRRSGWEEDDAYVEEERDIEYGSWNRNIYHASILIKHNGTNRPLVYSRYLRLKLFNLQKKNTYRTLFSAHTVMIVEQYKY